MSKDEARLTAVVGGIGSGKSMVCNILRMLRYDVYDCDSRARDIIDQDPQLRQRIANAIGRVALNSDGTYNRPAVSAIVFADPEKLSALNALVHEAVRNDINDWVSNHSANNPEKRLFVETAIPYQSGLHLMVDEIWEVTAPTDLRVLRVMARNNLTADQVRARINSQSCPVPAQLPPIHIIHNDNSHHLVPQVLELLDK